MKSTVEKLEASRVKISSEVTYDELKPAVDGAAKKLSQQVNIPGFRRGKVPTRVLESHIGRPAIIEQAVNDSLDRYYQQALDEHELTPLGQPEVEITEWPNFEGAEGGNLKFDISVDVKPEIELPDFADITLTVDRPEVKDEDVEERINDLRTRFATLKSVNRKIKKDDFVNIDMEASIDGKQIDSVSGISYQLGSGQLLEGIDKALTGQKEGDTVEFVSKLAGGEHEGEEADVKVTIHSVKVQELPEADDDFAQLASEFDTMDELREDVAKETEKDKLADVVYQARDLLLDKLREEVEMEIPTGVIDAEIKRHLESEGKEADDKHGEEIRKETEDGFRNQMILDAIAADRKVGIEQDELFQFMVQQAQMYGMDPNQFIQAAAQTNQIPAFAGELTRNKAVISSLRDVTVVDGDGNEVDITSIINSELGEEDSGDEEKKAPAKKAPAKKTAAKKAPAKKATASKTAAKKDDEAPAKKTTSRKTAAKKAEETEEKAPAKKTAAKKAPAKKATASKTAAKKDDEAPAKKTTTRKTAAKKAEETEEKAPAKKPAAKKAPAKKPAAKKPAAKKADEK